MGKENNQKWMTVIKPKTGWRDINLREVWEYKDLIILFVKRSFSTRYKQTILGPAWMIVTPIVSTILSSFVFGDIAGIKPDGDIPYFLFYMCGSVLWSYFSNCFSSTSSTFTGNAGIFGKVYFPRLVTPISSVITGFLDFCIHFGIFAAFLVYFKFFTTGWNIQPNLYLLLLPVLLLEMACLGLGLGVIVSSLTTKYRDLTVLIGFGMSLWSFLTPIIYPLSMMEARVGKWATIVTYLNPMAPVIEIGRYALLGTGTIPWGAWGVSLGVTAVLLTWGVVLFSRVEKTFMDTV